VHDSLHSRLDALPRTSSGDLEARRAREATRAMLFGRATPIAIGRYRVNRRIGAGGMGVVYAARDEDLRREVAIKVLHGAGDARARARMRREAEALARLSDPHVVQVFEVGEHDGRIFIVMELVQGTTLAAWQRGRTAAEIVAMYRRAGLGLAAAHKADLVHRDFKPDNVLVGLDGRPRVADFGLVRTGAAALGTDPDAPESGGSGPSPTDPTGTDGVLGTLAYMAPEQHRGAAVGPAADQFSFCVALWEALFGERPFVGRTRWALAEATAQGDIRRPVALSRALAPIERVLARGLAARPTDRWPSMAALVRALDPGERRGPARAIGALGVALVVGAIGVALATAPDPVDCAARAEERVGSVWGEDRREVLRAAFARSGGDRAAATWGRVAPRVEDWMDAWREQAISACEDTRGVHDDPGDLAVDVRAACLETALDRMDALLSAFAAEDARIDAAPGAIGRVDDPAACLDPAPRLQDRVDDEARLVELSERLVRLQAAMDAGRYEPSLSEAQALVRDAEAIEAPRLATRALLVVGEAALLAGDPAVALTELEATFHAAERLELHEEAAQAGLALIHLTGLRMADHAQADRWIRHVEVAVERSGTRRAQLAFARAAVLSQQGRAEEGVAGMREALELAAVDPGRDDPFYFDVVAGLGGVLYAAGRHEESVAQSKAAIELIEAALGPEHPKIVAPLSNLSASLVALGRTEEAIAAFERALALRMAAFGPGHFEVAKIQLNLGIAQIEARDTGGAFDNLSAAIAGITAAMGPDHPLVALGRSNLASVIGRRGDLDAAEREYREVVRIVDLTPEQIDQRAEARESLGELLLHRGEVSAAREELEAALALRTEHRGENDPLVARARSRLASALVQTGEHTRARELLKAARDVLEGSPDTDPVELGVVCYELGAIAFEAGELDEAETELRTALRHFEGAPGTEARQIEGVKTMLERVRTAGAR
jgi:tetratricopeptide (TPR) repeat protein